jgi:hypothetical protein
MACTCGSFFGTKKSGKHRHITKTIIGYIHSDDF